MTLISNYLSNLWTDNLDTEISIMLAVMRVNFVTYLDLCVYLNQIRDFDSVKGGEFSAFP